MIKFHIERDRERESTLYNAASIPRVIRVNNKNIHPPQLPACSHDSNATNSFYRRQRQRPNLHLHHGENRRPRRRWKITGRRTCRAKKTWRERPASRQEVSNSILPCKKESKIE